MKKAPFKFKTLDTDEASLVNQTVELLYKYKLESVKFTNSSSTRLQKPFQEIENGVKTGSGTETVAVGFQTKYSEIFNCTVTPIGSASIYISDITSTGMSVNVCAAADYKFFWGVKGSLE